MNLVPNEYKSMNRPGSFSAPAGGARPHGLNFAAMPENVSLKGWLIAAAAFLALAISAYAGLWFYQRNLSEEVRELNKKNEEALALLDKKTVKNLVDAEADSEIIFGLLQNHKSVSRFMDILAAATLPKVQWLSLSADLERNGAALSGKAAGFTVLARQLTALKEDAIWKNIKLSNISPDKDGYVGFGLELEFEGKAVMTNQEL